MSFLEALARAGRSTTVLSRVKIVLARQASTPSKLWIWRAISKSLEPNYQLEPGDIVYVPKSGLAKLGYVMQQINPITSMVALRSRPDVGERGSAGARRTKTRTGLGISLAEPR